MSKNKKFYKNNNGKLVTNKEREETKMEETVVMNETAEVVEDEELYSETAEEPVKEVVEENSEESKTIEEADAVDTTRRDEIINNLTNDIVGALSEETSAEETRKYVWKTEETTDESSEPEDETVYTKIRDVKFSNGGMGKLFRENLRDLVEGTIEDNQNFVGYPVRTQYGTAPRVVQVWAEEEFAKENSDGIVKLIAAALGRA